jgi:hypothetical protein
MIHFRTDPPLIEVVPEIEGAVCKCTSWRSVSESDASVDGEAAQDPVVKTLSRGIVEGGISSLSSAIPTKRRTNCVIV